jgi:hypothetical protein
LWIWLEKTGKYLNEGGSSPEGADPSRRGVRSRHTAGGFLLLLANSADGAVADKLALLLVPKPESEGLEAGE